MHEDIQLPRRSLWKAGIAGLGTVASAGLGISALTGNAQAQVSGQNFDVITWKRMPNSGDTNNVTSSTWIQSNAGGSFIKQRDDTCLWMICNLGFVPTTGRTSFIGMFVDGSVICRMAQSGAANQIQGCSMTEIVMGFPHGTRQCQVYVAVELGSSCSFRTSSCSFTVMEVKLPSPQL
jgi:hypothetical protein